MAADGIVDLDLYLDSPLRFWVETDELNRLALYGRAPSHIAGNYIGRSSSIRLIRRKSRAYHLKFICWFVTMAEK